MGADPDIEHVEAALAGDEGSFEELVRHYQRPIFALVLRMCGDPGEAPDVVQRIFLKAYIKLRTFRRRSTFKTWLYAIAINLCRNELRRRRRWGFPERIEDVEPRVEPGISEGLIGREQRRSLAEAVAGLPPKQRSVLVLRIYEELSFREIAESVGISENAAKVNFHHAVKRLRDEIGEDRER